MKRRVFVRVTHSNGDAKVLMRHTRHGGERDLHANWAGWFQDIQGFDEVRLLRKDGGSALNNRIKRTGCPFLLAVVLLLLVACGGADPVTIATGGDYHPFNFVNYQG